VPENNEVAFDSFWLVEGKGWPLCCSHAAPTVIISHKHFVIQLNSLHLVFIYNAKALDKNEKFY